MLFSWSAFGLAFAFLIASVLLAGIQYLYCRWQWVLTPSSISRKYSAALIILPSFYIISTVIENIFIGPGPDHLPYESIPQASLILFVHYLAYRSNEPASITMGMALVIATAAVAIAAYFIAGAQLRPAQWAAGATALILVAFTLIKTSCTKKAFLSGRFTTELETDHTGPSNRWSLSTGQYVALVVASLGVAVVAEMLKGVELHNLLALNILIYSVCILALTAAIVAIPAALHWLAAKRPLPDLDWVVWAVWLITSSSLLYLQHLMAA